MSPREFQIYIDARSEIEKNKIDELLYLAWHTAVLVRYDGKIPELSELIKPKEKPKEQNKIQSETDMFVTIQALNAMYGGVVEIKE